MLTKIAVVLGVIAVAAAAATSKAETRRPNYDFVNYGNCENRLNGNYTHPTDCTRFIKCSNKFASDMACPDCDKNNEVQCAGQDYLVWDQSVERCEWPATTQCVVDGEIPTTEDPPTTSETPEGPSTAAPITCKNMTLGAVCDKNDCEVCGWCKNKLSQFLRCQRTRPDDPNQEITGEVVLESCDPGSWWNPQLKPDEVTVGGACVSWADLPQDIKDQYKADKECIEEEVVCVYGQDEGQECTEKYYYDEANKPRQDLECLGGYIWDSAIENCRNCSFVPSCAGKGICPL